MATIPLNVILIWTGTHASIPAGWARETLFDGKFLKGWDGTTPNLTGGAASHSHSSPAHTHTMNNHTHTFDLSSAAQGSPLVRTQSEGVNEVFNSSHTHGTTTSGGVVGGSVTDSCNYGSVSNNPPYKEVIFIYPNAGAAELADNISAFWNGASLPTGWTEDVSYQDKYLRGAGTGQNAGATGGSYTNVHDISHNHTATNHSHSAAVTPSQTGANVQGQGGGLVNQVVHAGHVHTATLNNSGMSPVGFSGSLTTPETVEPLHKKLVMIKKGSSGIKELGIIGLWIGAIGSIPKGWSVCDGTNGTPDMRNYHFKVAVGVAQRGATGGSNTHTHAAQSHSHSGVVHAHTGSASAHVGGQNDLSTGSPFEATDYRYIGNHSVQNVATASAEYAAANTTADSSNNEPEYRTAAFIQYKKPIANAGAFFAGILN